MIEVGLPGDWPVEDISTDVALEEVSLLTVHRATGGEVIGLTAGGNSVTATDWWSGNTRTGVGGDECHEGGQSKEVELHVDG